MKNNNTSNFDQKIHNRQTASTIINTSEENNQLIQELNNNMISNQLNVNRISPNFNNVSFFIINLIIINTISL